jgi:UDP-N-acetylmuramate--alanine ligase
VVTYGIDKRADYRADNVKFERKQTSFEVYHQDKQLGVAYIEIPGLHNVRNALAAFAVACEMGVEFEKAASSVAKFQGVKRRFEVVGEAGGVTVVDDYAHHPAEIKATLEAARGKCGGRVTAVFQPHLYTRTRDFMEQFAASLSMADEVIVTGIYKAREEPIPGVEAADIVNIINGGMSDKLKAVYVDDKNDCIDKLKGKLCEGDMVIFMGAGDIWETARDFVIVTGGNN